MCMFCYDVGMAVYLFFFFNDTATTEIYTLSLHDALPICVAAVDQGGDEVAPEARCCFQWHDSEATVRSRYAGGRSPGGSYRRRSTQRSSARSDRSEEHTSELQSQFHLVCRLLLEKKKYNKLFSLIRRHSDLRIHRSARYSCAEIWLLPSAYVLLRVPT